MNIRMSTRPKESKDTSGSPALPGLLRHCSQNEEWSQPSCLFTDEWINKMLYSVIKKN